MQKGFIVKQNYIKDLTIVEHIILWSDIVLLLGFFTAELVVNKTFNTWQTWLTFIAGIISIFSVMAGVKKKPLCPFLGIIGSMLLLPIAWYSKLPATMIMYAVNLIIQTVSLITWIKNTDNTASIRPTQTSWWKIVIYMAILVGLIALFTWIESLPGYNKLVKPDHSPDAEPLDIRIFDSGTLIFTLGCCLPMIFRLNFVWTMYILNDSSQLALWICKIVRHPLDMNQWTMWASVLGLLATSTLGLVRWYQQSKNTKN